MAGIPEEIETMIETIEEVAEALDDPGPRMKVTGEEIAVLGEMMTSGLITGGGMMIVTDTTKSPDMRGTAV